MSNSGLGPQVVLIVLLQNEGMCDQVDDDDMV